MENNLTMEQSVWTEEDLVKLLGITKRTLDNLRNEKGLPYVRLTAKCRVYLVEDILEWLKQYRRSVKSV